MADYRKKIEKLLALSESPNEHEAKAALLKARQLMAEHKLCEEDFKDREKRTVVEIDMPDITCSLRRDPWIVDLSSVIGDAYCCVGYRKRMPRKQTNMIGFMGLEEDAEVCAQMFRYAVECVRKRVSEIKEENKEYYPEYVRRLCDSYGTGFVIGVRQEFKQQAEQNQEWGLVLVKPQEVEEKMQSYGKEEFRKIKEEAVVGNALFEGITDGREFHRQKRIGGE